jgi:DNA-binding CsgD family transcriptional regulator
MSASDDDLWTLFERVARTEKFLEGHALLREALSRHGITHVAYGAVNLPTMKRHRGLVAVSYAPEWRKHYTQSGYVDIDPVVKAGLGGILPVDWNEVDRSNPLVKRFFGESLDFGVGPSGISIPVRGRNREFALFSVASDLRGRDWDAMKRERMRDFMLLAYQFHTFALQAEGLEVNDFRDKLTLREKECLRWRAVGKSDWDISQIMSISERTVKFHLENARAKLGATNTTHAVSKALTLNLITLVESV